MRKLYMLFIMVILGSSFSAQELFTCYDEWRKVFENRGVETIEDGIHDNIVVTVRSEKGTECLIGRVEVVASLVTKLYIYFDDNSYEEVVYEFKKKEPWSFYNGITRTRVTENDEMINILFTDRIAPKKKKQKVAPKPDFDLN